MAERTLTAMYDTRGAAESARDQLVALGVPSGDVTIHGTGVLSAFAPASIARAESKPMRGQAASKIPSTAAVLRRRSSLRRSAGTCW